MKIATYVASPAKPSEPRNSTQAISATAPPPTPLKSATICGIAVIFTRRADRQPMAVPKRDAEQDQRPVRCTVGRSSVAIDRDGHADGRDAVAAHRRGRAGEA